MTSPIKAIIFDFGNVLLEWNPRYVYQRYFPNDPEGMEHFLEEVDFMNWNAQQDKGRTFAEGVALLSEQFPHYSGLHPGLSRQLARFDRHILFGHGETSEGTEAGGLSGLRVEQLVGRDVSLRPPEI